MTKFIKIPKNNNIELITSGTETPHSILLCLHGFNSNRWGDGFGKFKKALDGVLVCSFDSAGHGESPVNSLDLRVDLLIEEISTIVDYLSSTYPSAQISILGTSYGGYRAAIYLSKFGNNIENVILINPAFKMLKTLEFVKDFNYNELKNDDLIPMKKSLNKFLKKDFLDDLYNNNVYEMKYNLKNPITIFISENDTLIPRQDTLDFANIVKCDIKYICDEHNLEKDESWNTIINYLEKIL